MAQTKILYVEDEDDDVLFMRLAFERAGWDQALDAVGDGRRAIEYLRSRLLGQSGHSGAMAPLPKLILLDINLPVISGFEVLQWLRSEPRLRDIPVIIVSSSNRVEDRQKATELGANRYVLKPASGLQFIEIVKGLKESWPELALGV